VETHLTFFVLNPFPVPRPPDDDALRLRVVSLAGRLACSDERFAEWAEEVGVGCGPLEPDEKDDLIHELDAVVAHLYGLSEKQLQRLEEAAMRPVFIDNRDGNTLQKAITAHLHSLRKAGATPEELCISTAYFNPQGLELLAGEAEHIGRIRLLLGVEPTPETLTRRRNPDDPPEPKFTRVWISNELEKLEKGLRTDRDLLPFDPATDRAVRRLLGFLRSGKVESRRYRGHFLHAKAFLFRGPDRGILSGSSNLTAAGLRTNLELNFGFYDDPLVGKVEEWFDELWDEAEPFDLAAIYEELLQEYPPYLIYLKVLWQLYGDELRAEEEAAGRIPITTFQKHGVWRARRILEKYGGVLIADGVGLGKTFLAGELIRGYRDRRQRVLLICPASLRDSVWQQFLHDYQLFVDTVSYEQLARDAQLGGERTHLKSALEEYALVVIDEAHNGGTSSCSPRLP